MQNFVCPLLLIFIQDKLEILFCFSYIYCSRHHATLLIAQLKALLRIFFIYL